MSPTEEQIQEFLSALNKRPNHIAIIMDGNGRWAKQKGFQRERGHIAGAETLDKIVRFSARIGLTHLTLYAFSTENWGRPRSEVEALMELLLQTIAEELPRMLDNNIRLNAIGDLERLPKRSRDALYDAMEKTSENTGLTLTLALSYSSRWEITKAMKSIARDVAKGILKIEDIDEDTVSGHLETKDMPDPDLLIRTGGEQRISNYLLWQAAYTELYFTPTYWPDFDEEDLMKAIDSYANRERRFGLTGEQVTGETH